jgi:membrane fusion protein, multidrug efflux system
MIARIAKTGELEVRIPIALEDLATYKSENSATFKNSANEVVGTGKILRISDVVNQQTQSADVYYSIQPAAGFTIYNGMFLTATIEGEKQKSTMTIPRAAYVKGQVTLLVGDKLVRRKVLQSGMKPDSVFITGLQNGEFVLLEEVEKIDPKKKYLGIKR